MSSTRWLIGFNVALLALAGWLASQNRWVPAASLLAMVGLFALWQNVLYAAVPARSLRIEPFFHPTHYVQACLHTTMYCYLGLYWDVVPAYVPLLLAQILVGYLFDMLLSWSRRGVWRAGLGVVPIILSTNLFMWFLDDWFYLQLALIAGAFLGKEFITWEYGGRRRHIFNPSALTLTVASVLLIATGKVGITRGAEIAIAFSMPPNFYEVIFLLGLVVQALFITTPVSCGTAVAMFGWYLASRQLFGEPLLAPPIPAAVFLGLTFLVTDPATSPRSHLGRFLFGLAYGTGVFVTYVLLTKMYVPSFFDKLLIVPFVNLLVPAIDRMCARIVQWWQAISLPASSSLVAAGLDGGGARPKPATASASIRNQFPRFAWLTAYIIVFILILPTLKAKREESTILPKAVSPVSEEFKEVYLRHFSARQAVPEAYRPWGFKQEILQRAELRERFQHGFTSEMLEDLRSQQPDNAGSRQK